MKKSLILIIIGFFLYGISLFNGFVWDDEVLFSPVTTKQAYYRPVIGAFYSVLAILSGAQPFLYHFVQITFHIATAVLLYYLFQRFFKEKIAFILSLLFLVHPAAVEAVCFASALQEVVFTFTGVLGLYILARQKDISIPHIFIVIILSTSALLMKETGVVFFPLIFCYLFLFHRKNSTALFLFSTFSIIIVFTYGLVRLGGGNDYVQGGGLFPIMRVPFATRMMNVPLIILYYIQTFIFPFNLGIAQHWVVQSMSVKKFWGPLVAVIVFFVAGLSSRLSRDPDFNHSIKSKYGDSKLDSRLPSFAQGQTFLFFFLWLLVGLLPHLQIVPLNMTVAERWLYFSMIGLLGMLGIIVEGLKVSMSQSQKIQIGAVCVICLLFVRSFVRTLDWRDGLALYGSSISSTSSFDLQNNMGVELFRVGKYDEAKKYFEKSVKLAPYWWVNWNNLGAAYEREQNYAKAQEYYEKSVQNGDYQLAYQNLAKILVVRGTDKKKADVFLQKAFEKFPNDEVLKALQGYKKN